MTTSTTGIEKASAYMRGSLMDPLQLAAAIDVAMHPMRNIVLVRDTDELAPLNGYVIVAYTLTGSDLTPAWSAAIFGGAVQAERHTFPTRVEALQYATERGFRYIH